MMRGDAFAPSPDPKAVVGGLTVAMTLPNKAWLLTSPTGAWKLGWLKTLKNCAPNPICPFSQPGILVCFISVKSLSK
jgi:hypothetical protein